MYVADYFKDARSTAIYPDHARFFYPVLGLVGEMGEFVAKFDVMVDRMSTVKPSVELLQLEAGDVLWYIANTLLDLGLDASIFVEHCTGRVSPGPATFDLTSRFLLRERLKANVLASLGRISEVAKKALRDNNSQVKTEKKGLVLNEVCNVFAALCVAVELIPDISMDSVARANIEKLFSRKERGVLQGSGDNR
jgi:hypothetical protein